MVIKCKIKKRGEKKRVSTSVKTIAIPKQLDEVKVVNDLQL